jgi:hypothetical protein
MWKDVVMYTALDTHLSQMTNKNLFLMGTTFLKFTLNQAGKTAAPAELTLMLVVV